MKKQVTLIIFIILLCGYLYAGSQYVYLTNGFEPSAINLALGGNPIAVVNFWHNDPLTSYSNPAFTSLHKGISYSSSNYNFMKLSSDIGTLDYKASITAFGYKGIGLVASIIPGYTTESNYGETVTTNPQNIPGPTIELIDRANVYGLSIDLKEFSNNFIQNVTILPKGTDLALGLNYIRNSNTLTGQTRYAHSFDFGVLGTMSLVNRKLFQIEGALGVSMFNVFNNSQDKLLSDGEETIYRRLNIASGISSSTRNPSYRKEQSFGVQNLSSLRILGGRCLEYASDELSYGFGAELGLCDVLFLRVGKHKNEEGLIEGKTYGAGLRVHYRNLIGIRYDYAHFPVVSGFEDKTSHSFGFDVDLLGFLNPGKLCNEN